jgi:hypothetical protein
MFIEQMMGANLSILQLIKKIATQLKEKELMNLDTVTSLLDELKNRLHLDTNKQVVAFIVIFDRMCGGRASDFDDMSHYYKCTCLEMMEYAADVEDMVKKGFACNNDRTVHNISKKQYLIDEVLFNSIVENKPIKVTPMKETQLDPLQFCVYIERLVSRRDDNDMSTRTLFSVIKEEEDKASLTLTKKLKKIFKDIADRVIFYVVICNFLKTDTKECTTIDNLMDNLYDYIPDRARIGRLLNSENHPLMKAGLIELIASNYLALTDDGCQLLFGNNASLWMEQTCNLDRYAFVNTVQELIEKISVESKNYLVKLEKKITKLENHSPELTVIQNLKDTVPSPIDRTLFYLVAKDMTEGCEFNLQSELCKIYNCKKDEFLIRAKFKDGTHILQKNKLVELSNKGLFNDAGKKSYG